MTTDVSTAVADFGPIADTLREQMILFHEERRQPLSGYRGLNTLETNSGLVERRSQVFLRMWEKHSGTQGLEGVDVVDLGCGFGTLAVFFASRGARVTAVDPVSDRFFVGNATCRLHGLDIDWVRGRLEELPLQDRQFDLAIVNNALCYLIEPAPRAVGLLHSMRVLRHGGLLAMRNPNLLAPVDPFTRLPFLHWLRPSTSVNLARRLGRSRPLVRLKSTSGAKRELRRVGWSGVKTHVSAAGPVRRATISIAVYQHVSAVRAL